LKEKGKKNKQLTEVELKEKQRKNKQNKTNNILEMD